VSNGMDDERFQKSQDTSKRHRAISETRVGRRYHGTMDKIQDMVLEEEEEEEEEEERTCVRSVMTDAIEIRAETTIIKRPLRTTETRTLRCNTAIYLSEIQDCHENEQETSMERSRKRDGIVCENREK